MTILQEPYCPYQCMPKFVCPMDWELWATASALGPALNERS